MSRRLVLFVLLGVAAIALVAAWYFGYIWPSEGPLGGGAGNRAGSTATPEGDTAIFFLPQNTTDSTFVLEGAAPVGFEKPEFKNLGIGVTEHCGTEVERNCVNSLSAGVWPPAKTEPAPVEGYVVEPGDQIRILMGMQILPRRMPGWLSKGETRGDSMFVRGMVVRYRDRFRHYRTEIGPEAFFEISVRNRDSKRIRSHQAWIAKVQSLREQ